MKKIVDIEVIYVHENIRNCSVTYDNGEKKIRKYSISNSKMILSVNGIIDAKYVGSYNPTLSLTVYAAFIVTRENKTKEVVSTVLNGRICTMLTMLSEGKDISAYYTILDGPKENGKNEKSEDTSKTVTEVQREISADGAYPIMTNELPRGKYYIGKNIPRGTYDFFVVYGNGGSFDYYLPDENGKITEGCGWISHHIGLKESYEKREILHVKCDEGYCVVIKGNVIVKIAKSQEVKIDL